MFTLKTALGDWRIVHPARKLALRGALPGAAGWDRAADGFRLARAQGASLEALLPAAFPTSWMVNSRAASPVFQQWLSAPFFDGWCGLIELLAGGPAAWRAADGETRALVAATVAKLCPQGHGVAALSKVLGVMVPESVPLMDDAALWWSVGRVARPENPDAPKAGADCFVPMMDWFAEAATEQEDLLAALAQTHPTVSLDAAQVLDRLVWFESYGWQIVARGARWWWVDDGRVQGLVESVDGPDGRAWSRDSIKLADVVDDAWRRAARDALYGS